MNKVTRNFAFVVGAALFAFSQSSVAADCALTDATANGEFADDCRTSTDNLATPSASTKFVNDQWGTLEEFSFIGKYEEDESSFDNDGASSIFDGFVLTVTDEGIEPDPDAEGENLYKYSYSLTVPEEYNGTIVDWILGFKQGKDDYVAYLFNGVVLGIEGEFNNFVIKQTGNGGTINDYSHADGFVRLSTAIVPEPGTALLMLMGLTGLFAARRRISAKA